MKFVQRIPVRKFRVGRREIIISDCGNLILDSDEQITFLRKSGAEYDVAAKDWGFYATPSTNGRLVEFGFRTVLVKNRLSRKRYVLVMEKGHENSFFDYLREEMLDIELWLDE